MSEEEFEIRGAHEDAVEHATEHHFPLGQTIALFSAVLATLGAVVSFLGGHTQNEALYYKNEAVLMKARASDAWNFYQAESVKKHLAEMGAVLAPQQAADYAAKAATYESKRRELELQAREFDMKSDEANVESTHALAPHNKLAISMTFLQIAIALGSITVLTRRRWLLWGAGSAGLAGVVLAVWAWF